MKHKILVGYEGTAHSLAVIEYLIDMVKLSPAAFEIVLFHVLPPLPMSYVEYGDLPGKGDEKERLAQHKKLLAQLKTDIETRCERIFCAGEKLFKKAGLALPETKFTHCTTDTAGEIIQEVEGGGYKTVVLGRKGQHSLKKQLLGDTAEKVARYVKNCAVWIIE